MLELGLASSWQALIYFELWVYKGAQNWRELNKMMIKSQEQITPIIYNNENYSY